MFRYGVERRLFAPPCTTVLRVFWGAAGDLSPLSTGGGTFSRQSHTKNGAFRAVVPRLQGARVSAPPLSTGCRKILGRWSSSKSRGSREYNSRFGNGGIRYEPRGTFGVRAFSHHILGKHALSWRWGEVGQLLRGFFRGLFNGKMPYTILLDAALHVVRAHDTGPSLCRRIVSELWDLFPYARGGGPLPWSTGWWFFFRGTREQQELLTRPESLGAQVGVPDPPGLPHGNASAGERRTLVAVWRHVGNHVAKHTNSAAAQFSNISKLCRHEVYDYPVLHVLVHSSTEVTRICSPSSKTPPRKEHNNSPSRASPTSFGICPILTCANFSADFQRKRSGTRISYTASANS